MAKSFWDDNAQVYLDKFERKRKEPSRQFIIDIMRDGGYSSILECGIGNGDFLDMFKEQISRPIDYTGVDITQSFIDYVKKNHPDAKFVRGDMQDLSQFNDEQFDVVYTRHTLEHIPYYKTAISELARVAKCKVVIILFHPLQKKDKIIVKSEKHNLFNNYYGKGKFIKCLNKHFSSYNRVVFKGGIDEHAIECLK